MLSVTDYRLIQQQCENQHATTPRDFIGMAIAYQHSQFTANLVGDLREDITSEWLIHNILVWGYMVDDRNVNGWRRVPVQVGNDIKLQPELIDREMKLLIAILLEDEGYKLTPVEAYEQFEDIHPFIDGNGRVGHVLWAWYTTYLGGQWPQTLPPDVFNQGIEGASSLDPDGNIPSKDEQYV